MNSNYRSGYTFELRIAGILQTNGYYVIRAAGSHGIADLVAMKTGETVFVQCKAGQSKIPLPEWNRLYAVASMLGAIPVLVTRDRLGRVTWTELTGTAAPRETRPGKQWHPDMVGAL